jgi:hypothetical protein
MRSYKRNSPQAAARIVALALLADSHLCQSELDTLDRLGVHQQLGLPRDEMQAIIHAFCEDLLSAASLGWMDACRLDPRTLRELMAEVDDPELCRKVLRLCIAVVDTDNHRAEGESIVIGAATEHWGLHRTKLQVEPSGAPSHFG